MQINYLIQNTRTGHLKIGYTRCQVKQRLGQLQTGSADNLVVLATMYGTRRSEHAMHVKFARYRVSGEWFKNKAIIRYHFRWLAFSRWVWHWTWRFIVWTVVIWGFCAYMMNPLRGY